VEKAYTVALSTDPGRGNTVTITNRDDSAVSVDTDTTTDGNQNTLMFTPGSTGN